MKPFTTPVAGALALALAACAPARTSAPVPVLEPVTITLPASDTLPTPPALLEAPLGWHLLDPTTDGVQGISVLHAERELLAGRAPRRTVVVAVIDNGVDTAHVDLRANLWRNPRETPNGRDDDGNGFADDIYGWNLLGGPDGRNVHQDTYELTRLVAQCERGGASRDSLPARYRSRCTPLRSELARKRSEAEQALTQLRQIDDVVSQILPMLRAAAGTDSLTADVVTAIPPTTAQLRQAREIYLQLAANGLRPEDVAEIRKAYESQVLYGYNLDFDPRGIVGDAYPDTSIRHYGNPDATGPDAGHGTHVAGIIAAIRNEDAASGIATGVRIMSLRAVPDGDERDKDVANAIRYAVDNGAHIINMSFGKGHSPYKELVDAAVRYADSRGVLMVHAAGNDGANSDESPSYPTPVYLDGGRAQHWIEVGATSWRGGDSLVASFSNYGASLVDVFAPGEDIYSTVPGGHKRESGTSMASPVVAGLAALIMSHYPELSALEVKRVILESATRLGDRTVQRPGGGTVRFGELSASGGIVNAYAALRLAAQMAAGR